MLVELKDGETLNGHLVSCDTWMNLVLKEVVQTSPDGDRFFRLQQVYVRGNNVRQSLFSKRLEKSIANPKYRSNICASQTRLSTSSRNSNSETRQTDRCAEVTQEEITKVEEAIAVGEAVDGEATEEEDVDEAHEEMKDYDTTHTCPYIWSST
jgi:hypothetical protein